VVLSDERDDGQVWVHRFGDGHSQRHRYHSSFWTLDVNDDPRRITKAVKAYIATLK
jgi:hypothetical protein